MKDQCDQFQDRDSAFVYFQNNSVQWELLYISCFHHQPGNILTSVTSYGQPSTSAPVSELNIWTSTNFNMPEKANVEGK